MGSRLNLTVRRNERDIANAYYQSNGYFNEAMYMLSCIENNLRFFGSSYKYDYKEKEFDSTVGFDILLTTGAGLREVVYKGEEEDENLKQLLISRQYKIMELNGKSLKEFLGIYTPVEKIYTTDFMKLHKAIAVSKNGMKDNDQGWTFKVVVDLDNNVFDLSQYFHTDWDHVVDKDTHVVDIKKEELMQIPIFEFTKRMLPHVMYYDRCSRNMVFNIGKKNYVFSE